MLLPITLATTGGAGLINLWLAVRTGMVRRPAGVMIGDGGHPLLQTRMRAHANFVEYAPFVLLLIAAIEFAAGSATWLWVVSAIFLLGRLAHPLGMEAEGGGGIGRMIGFATTALILLGLSVYAALLPLIGTPAPAMIRLG